MRINIMTLFPEMFTPLSGSILGRALDSGILEFNIVNIRDNTVDKHNRVDDTPYGGGAGMVLRCEPIFSCIDDIKTDDSYVILMCPTGKTFSQKKAIELKDKKHLIIICGHYEGFDERIKTLADEIISIGDYILTGGELAAMVISDSVIRLLDGVISSDSLQSESFSDGLLDYPVYTKPEIFRDMSVPSILLSGNHQKIKEYRNNERIRVTKEVRSDLMGD